jgi:hypothetical protein
MSLRRNARRLHRKTAEVTPKEILYDVGDHRVQLLLNDVTLVFTRSVPLSRAWLERTNRALEVFKLGAILMSPIKDRTDLVALTWGMTLRAKEAADIKWGVGLPPTPTASRKEIEEKDPTNAVSPFSQVCTVVVEVPPEPEGDHP